MAKVISLTKEKKNEWVPFARIELSESEAAKLAMLLGAVIGEPGRMDSLYADLYSLFYQKPTSNVIFDTNQYSDRAKNWLKSKGEI